MYEVNRSADVMAEVLAPSAAESSSTAASQQGAEQIPFASAARASSVNDLITTSEINPEE